MNSNSADMKADKTYLLWLDAKERFSEEEPQLCPKSLLTYIVAKM